MLASWRDNMFHINDESVRSQLLKGNFGLEKESLRITSDGSFALSLHPFPGDKNIVYDFCENQTEINTDVAASAQEAQDRLLFHTFQVHKKLVTMDEPEYLWPFSNPPFIRNEHDIPIAHDAKKTGYSKTYREYLADRYGRYKMSLSGIHVNFSFSDALLRADFALSELEDYEEYKNKVYLELASGLSMYGWIVTALTAASPLLDGSYYERGKRGITAFNGLASTRCSELGYWNYFVPTFDYSNIQAYAASIRQYLDSGLIISPTELYYPIRLKSYGKNNLERLAAEGVSHIELRTIDLNPFELSGINLKDLKFIQLLYIWIASNPVKELSLRDQVQVAQNFKNAAHYDLKTVKIVIPDGRSRSVVKTGFEIIDKMKSFYHDFSEAARSDRKDKSKSNSADHSEVARSDRKNKIKSNGADQVQGSEEGMISNEKLDEIMDILAFEEEKLRIPEKRYAWMIREQFGDDFAGRGLELARDLQERILLDYAEP